jgi:hypothetical protein
LYRRIFYFFNDFDIIVLGDGFQKKTPQKEIDGAIKNRKEYYYKKIILQVWISALKRNSALKVQNQEKSLMQGLVK